MSERILPPRRSKARQGQGKPEAIIVEAVKTAVERAYDGRAIVLCLEADAVDAAMARLVEDAARVDDRHEITSDGVVFTSSGGMVRLRAV
jgi:hypothetical protein